MAPSLAHQEVPDQEETEVTQDPEERRVQTELIKHFIVSVMF